MEQGIKKNNKKKKRTPGQSVQKGEAVVWWCALWCEVLWYCGGLVLRSS